MKKQMIRFVALFLTAVMMLSGCAAGPAEQTTISSKTETDPIKTTNEIESISTDTTMAECDDSFIILMEENSRSAWKQSYV